MVSAWLAVQATRAERQAQDARRAAHQAVNRHFTRVSESTLLRHPDTEELRWQLLNDALDYYKVFVDTYGDDPELQAELAAAYYRISVLTYDIDADASRKKKGTGLGLAIVKHIVNRHRGQMSIKSKPGEGMRVDVFLKADASSGSASAGARQLRRT